MRKIDGLTEDEFDKLTLILGLVGHKWSFRKIGRMISADSKTVKSLYDKALRLKKEGKLLKNVNSEKALRILYVGTAIDIEYLESKQHGEAGGGKRIRPTKYNDNWEDC